MPFEQKSFFLHFPAKVNEIGVDALTNCVMIIYVLLGDIV